MEWIKIKKHKTDGEIICRSEDILDRTIDYVIDDDERSKLKKK